MPAFFLLRGLSAVLVISPLFLSVPHVSRADEPPSQVVAVLLRDGQEALAADRFGEAYARLSEALELDWNNPRAYDLLQEVRFARGLTLLKWEADAREAEARGDLSKAKWIFERILSEDSTRDDLRDRVRRLGTKRDAAFFIRSGMEKFIADDFAGAQLDFEQALAISPKDTLAEQYRERTRKKIAASMSLSAIQADGADWRQYLEALRKLREGDLPAAERLWNDLLVKYPANESILSNLEQVRMRLGHERANADDE
jgi:predicted Zn-dependent protease